MTRRREAAGAAILVLMALSAAYGGGFFGLRDRFPPPAGVTRADPFRAVDAEGAQPAGGAAARRSSPYWRELTRFDGEGDATTAAFAIDRRALQWRTAWRCERGSLAVQPQRPSGTRYGHALAREGNCPASGTGLSVARGRFRLAVDADGPWGAVVEQQLDVPVIEAPPRELASRSARRIARGAFYDVDEDGEGSVVVTRLPDGSSVLSLENFYVTPNVDLEIRLSSRARPRTTQEVVRSPFEDVAVLDATAGTMHFRVPPGRFGADVRSVVIWCEATRNAYAAASLRTA